ncbi:DUF7379 domain-containing protein [Piscinibacter koreensis]|uniref:CHAT domain-containing protein n=1 Tax=Piscinibacter koreensis TaxID=2742824 RepID=A0A7Y6NJD8_9BURK|nr:CHAT domain-containing protein [Schlegelella koreensis]NUZ04276.1 CHAT domain-containing protein [Schlegelella koreensis]
MAAHPAEITFRVPGQPEPGATAASAAATRGGSADAPPATVVASVRVGTARDAGGVVTVTARPDRDVVVLGIANGPTLVLNPLDARDLLRAQQGAATRSASAGSGDVAVPVQLGWPGLEAAATRGATRGWMGQAALGLFQVVTGPLQGTAVDLVSAAVTKRVDGAVDAGVYQLTTDLPGKLKGSSARRDKVPSAPDGGPLLVLVHGTFVDTASTFGKLWVHHGSVVRDLFARYAGRVYALDHPTMGESPIANALTLARALPPGARVHLVTHSRGGLVAEALARACAGIAPTELDALFAGPGFEKHRDELRALVDEAQGKGLRVERIVRVACPARGTLLASKRLDAYVSVLKWCLELASVPVAPELVDFLHEVAQRRARPDELPGLEAMMPGSPVLEWLNGAPPQPIAGDLRVVAGDLEGDSVGSWVKTLLADAFYWTDNDLVVQTRSMYGGAPRAGSAGAAESSGATFLLDRGGKVTHFNYFANERTVRALAAALADDLPDDFRAIGPLSWAGRDASGTRAARAVARSRGASPERAAERPAVFVLPGILGSNLKVDGHRLWLGARFVNGLERLAWDPATAASVEPDGPIDGVYGDLIERLADSHEVIPFAFDWRRPIEDEARRLADAIEAALTARHESQQPVRLVAHSMGGLVARAVQLERPATWQRLLARPGARVLMLGTPNAGSWSPMQTLSGDDTFGNALVAFGSIFDDAGARELMAAMPGFIQLQADLLDPTLQLDRAATWQQLADDDVARLVERSLWHDEGPQRTIYRWGAPPQGVLDQAVALRRRLDGQALALGADAEKLLLVVGQAPFTPAGISLGIDGLEYLGAADIGDGRVTHASACLPGVRTWRVAATHGDLPSAADAFAAYVELLQTGTTSALEPFDRRGLARGVPPPALRGSGPAGSPGAPSGAATPPGAAPGAAGWIRSRPSRSVQPSAPPSRHADVFAIWQAATRTPALQVAVLNADLKFIRQPLLLGHYRAMKLTGTEAVVDRLVARTMSRSLATGLYPDAPGEYQVFGNRREDPANVFDMARPEAAVVVGLGEEGKLRAADLTFTVRQAVLAYAQRVAELSGGGATDFEMAATLIGSGGTGISPGSAAQLVVQGGIDANERLREVGWPTLRQLTLVELYLERATDAWRAVQLQEVATPNRLKLAGPIVSGTGALLRSLDSNYRGTAYDLISARTVSTSPGERCIAFTLDTRRARAEVRAQHAQGSLLKELVLKASNDANRDPLIGRTLFNLLVPVEMEVFLGGTTEMVIELDEGTAGIPWELLDTNPDPQAADKRPWAIRSKLIRRLRVENFRAQVHDASADDSVLVIGEPKCSYPPLPGARSEAQAVGRRLAARDVGVAPDKLRLLVDNDDAQTIINALFERPYRVIHIAGHGAPHRSGGVVLSGADTYLGANEVRAMRVTPELVFLNCCHLAGRDSAGVLQPYDRAEFAANIADELIRGGVRCVVAAGWAVEDGPAEEFATAFYGALLGGARFIDAVARARQAAWAANPQGNTWAAYQCYGDPDWHWRRQVGDAQAQTASLTDRFAGIAAPSLLELALDNIATTCRSAGADGGDALAGPREDVRYLESRFGARWGDEGAVAEAFGNAYEAVNDVEAAIGWRRRALTAADGGASFKAAEQLGNHLVRHGAKLADRAAARVAIDEGLELLEKLVQLRPTFERASLLGSAYKRLTMLEWQARRRDAAAAALAKAVEHYERGAALARDEAAPNLFYPLKNGISCQLRAAFLQRRLDPTAAAVAGPRVDAARARAVGESLKQAAASAPDFWSVVGQTELVVLNAMDAGNLAGVLPAVSERFRELKARVAEPVKWDSVYSEAQFTLKPYRLLHRAGTPERRAAHALLALLRELASA